MRGFFYTAFIYSVYTYNIHTNMAAVGMPVHVHPPIFFLDSWTNKQKKEIKGKGNMERNHIQALNKRFQKAPGSSWKGKQNKKKIK